MMCTNGLFYDKKIINCSLNVDKPSHSWDSVTRSSFLIMLRQMVLKRVNSNNDLGVIIDQRMCFMEHIDIPIGGSKFLLCFEYHVPSGIFLKICLARSAMKILKLFRICLVVPLALPKHPPKLNLCSLNISLLAQIGQSSLCVFCQFIQNRIYVLFGTDYKIIWSVFWQYNFLYSIDLQKTQRLLDQFELKVKYKVNTDSVLVGVLEGLGAPPNIFGIVSKFS
jgi:hypothetical protein